MYNSVLAPHQMTAVIRMLTTATGQIVMPTGTGKTWVQAAITALAIEQKRFGIIVIKAPRIELCNQLSIEYNKFFSKVNLEDPFESILIHSGSPAEWVGEENEQEEGVLNVTEWIANNLSIKATASSNELRDLIRGNKQLDRPLVIFTTYHSNKKVIDTIAEVEENIYLDINDECHYLTQSFFSDILLDENYNPERRYFFTATPRVGESVGGRGQNNVDRFGAELFRFEPAEAIRGGWMLPVRAASLDNLTPITDQFTMVDAIGEMVLAAFNRTEETFTHLGAKMLVCSEGSAQIRRFLESPEFSALREMDVHILTRHSNEGLTTYNGSEITSKQFTSYMQTLGSDAGAKVILIHYDMLSEGIDIPGMLSTLILRNMGVAKFFQTLGRIVRVYRPNPNLKSFGLVMFPSNDADLYENFRRMCIDLHREGYAPVEFNSNLDNPKGEEDEEIVDLTFGESRSRIEADAEVGFLISEIDLSSVTE